MTIPKIVQAITYWPIYGTLKFFAHFRIEGQENLIGLEKVSVIFASNHGSFIDGPICAAAMPRQSWYPKDFFPIRFLAAKEYYNWNNPFPFPISILAAAYVRINGSIPVVRGLKDIRQSLAEVIEVLKAGDKIWIYPEGRMTRDGKLQPGKGGAIYLHKATNIPIIPVGLIGTFKILSIKSLLGLNRIKVKIGAPIYSLGSDDLQEGTEKIMGEIAKLIG